MKKFIALSAALFVVFNLAGYCQKLPKVQTESVRAPIDVTVDGQTTEWNSGFEAYNNSTQVFYIMANNDNNLYLVIQATDNLVIRKIIAGGITLHINNSANPKDKGGVSVTYPLFNNKNWPIINLGDRKFATSARLGQRDSFKVASNTELNKHAKDIKTIGVKALPDTLISVYNDEGVKAASQFDRDIKYTYELGLPLKYLGLSVDDPTPFSYTVTLNGSSFAEGTTIESIAGGTRVTSNGSKVVPIPDMQFIQSPTYFSGTYVLVKK